MMKTKLEVERFCASRRHGLGVAVVALSAMLAWPAAGRADAVLDWNTNLLEVIRAEHTLPMGGAAYGPGDISRAMAMTQVAVFEAVNSINRTYFPYRTYIPGGAGASPEAAVAQAAHDVLLQLYPNQQALLSTKLTTALTAIQDTPAKPAGIQLGQTAAQQIVALRSNDGAAAALVAPYMPNGATQDWKPTPPDQRPAYAPGWGRVTPFVVPDITAFRAPPPPDLTSQAYTDAFNEVKDLGSLTSTSRTEDQTKIGLFWGYDRKGMGTPPNLYNKIAQVVAKDQGNTLEENARLFALINLAMADAGISSWDTKYTYDFWRPITAIREGDNDGNPDTEGDSSWVPLGAPGPDPMTSCTDLTAMGCDDFTPPFPAYNSGHATFGAALFETLALFFGKDDIPFTMTSEEVYCDKGGNCAPITLDFDSFSQAAIENGRSRIYLGIHWNFDDELLLIDDGGLGLTANGGQLLGGRPVGRAIADYIFANALREVPAPPAAALLAAGLAGLGWLGRRTGNRRRR